jgi:FtsP/CotA-like multicopper oxidase with cupredoxin domain
MVRKGTIAMFIECLFDKCGKGILTLFILTIMTGTSAAADFYLRAAATTVTMPDGRDVTMWGFANCGGTFTGCDAVPPTIPGPTLTVPPGEALTVNLKNSLTVPVSLVIPGQSITPAPTFDGGRVMSFTTETGASGGTHAYTWNPIKPGTYIYQSGTNPAVQVQMGLYGAVKQDSVAGSAYPGVNYDNEVLLLFSEVDPFLHDAIGGVPPGGLPTYGTSGPTSTIEYHPKYFLINGQPFTASLPAIPAGLCGQKTLIRFLNAGLKDYVPLLQGLYMTILAEDGNPLPYSKSQYSLVLPAGKTMDAVITPVLAGTFRIYDRRLNLTNPAVPPIPAGGPLTSPGGMLTSLQVSGTCIASLVAGTPVPVPLVPSITVTAPNGGETWKRGTKHLITWTYTGNPGTSVKIELLRNGVLNRTIVSSMPKGTGGSGSYNWTIPSSISTGAGYAVRITSRTNSAYTDASNTTFTITP